MGDLYTFVGGAEGEWTVLNVKPVTGECLSQPPRLLITPRDATADLGSYAWRLRGVTSNLRYTSAAERKTLAAVQANPGSRPEATRAALIPIRKNAAWWTLAQDERRVLLEDTSQHIRKGLKYLPAIARRLHHSRDLSTHEEFDFLTWFDYAPADAQAFEDLVGELRATEEWKFVDREVDVRLALDPA